MCDISKLPLKHTRIPGQGLALHSTFAIRNSQDSAKEIEEQFELTRTYTSVPQI